MHDPVTDAQPVAVHAALTGPVNPLLQVPLQRVLTEVRGQENVALGDEGLPLHMAGAAQVAAGTHMGNVCVCVRRKSE